MRSGIFFFVGLLALVGCQSVTTRRNPAVDVSRYKNFFVERRLSDNHHLDELIAEELRRLGKTATSGPLTMKPDEAEAVVSYTDRWAEDFHRYLIELNIDVRDAHTDKPLTVGRFYQPSITPKNPPEMIREILTPLFGSAPSGK